MTKSGCSETFVGRDIFSTIWGLSILSALGNCEKIGLPFDRQYLSFIEENRLILSEFFGLIAGLTCLSKEVMDLLESESPWRFIPEKNYAYYDKDALNAELAITSGHKEYVEYNYDGLDAVRGAVMQSIVIQLVNLLDALLQGVFCFSHNKNDSCCLVISDVFRVLEKLLGECKPFRGQPFFSGVFMQWKALKYESILGQAGGGSEEYQKWLKTRVAELAAFVG